MEEFPDEDSVIVLAGHDETLRIPQIPRLFRQDSHVLYLTGIDAPGFA